ncbi:MAG: hypothetical protein ABIR48_03710 [Gammaproteobacteria bacterium]
MDRIKNSFGYQALVALLLALMAGCEGHSYSVVSQSALPTKAILTKVNNFAFSPSNTNNASSYSLRIFNPLADQRPAASQSNVLNEGHPAQQATERSRQIHAQAYIIKISAPISRPGQIDPEWNRADI